MLRIPLLLFLAAWPAALSLACRGEEDSVDPTAGIPFDPNDHFDPSSFLMTSNTGDTVWFRSRVDENDPHGEMVRLRRSQGRLDSLSATFDVRTKAPISSHHRVHTTEGALTADVAYGAGYQGQARLTVTTPQGELVDNLRTPTPYLDSAQIPPTFSALDFARPDTFTFNYIAPFEKEALNAQVVIGRLETVDLATGPAAAYPVRLRVSGLEERFWFDASSTGHRLLRWEDVTRGVTWTRVETTSP